MALNKVLLNQENVSGGFVKEGLRYFNKDFDQLVYGVYDNVSGKPVAIYSSRKSAEQADELYHKTKKILDSYYDPSLGATVKAGLIKSYL